EAALARRMDRDIGSLTRMPTDTPLDIALPSGEVHGISDLGFRDLKMTGSDLPIDSGDRDVDRLFVPRNDVDIRGPGLYPQIGFVAKRVFLVPVVGKGGADESEKQTEEQPGSGHSPTSDSYTQSTRRKF